MSIDHVFLDCFTERETVIEHNGRQYHFEFLTSCGWCAALPNGEGSPPKDHPKAVWAKLQKLIDSGKL